MRDTNGVRVNIPRRGIVHAECVNVRHCDGTVIEFVMLTNCHERNGKTRTHTVTGCGYCESVRRTDSRQRVGGTVCRGDWVVWKTW